MNESRVWLAPHGVLYEGPLPALDWHTHSFACLLISRGRPFEIETRAATRQVRVVLVPGALEHKLTFTADPMFTWYIAPHEPEYPALCTGRAMEILSLPERPGALDAALDSWEDARSTSDLREWVTQTWGQPAFHDRRVQRVLEGLWRGEGLLDAPRDLAQAQGISASRLSHLLKENTGSTLRALQRGYRFWHAARAMVGGTNYTDAAHEAQFADGAHLSRAFRQAYGLAPTHMLDSNTLWNVCEMS